MHAVVQDNLEALLALCERYQLLKLDLFGSAASDRFDPEKSDIDFLIELAPRPHAEYADAYFNLKADLEQLFERPVDLVTESSIQNPIFKPNIERSRKPRYAA